MRVLLRQKATGSFMQPTGDWGCNRDTAISFLSPGMALHWGLERMMSDAEVWICRADASAGFALMPVRASARAVIDCRMEQWQQVMNAVLFEGIEVDLFNFDFDEHAESCMKSAIKSQMQFSLDRDPNTKWAQFRKHSN